MDLSLFSLFYYFTLSIILAILVVITIMTNRDHWYDVICNNMWLSNIFETAGKKQNRAPVAPMELMWFACVAEIALYVSILLESQQSDQRLKKIGWFWGGTSLPWNQQQLWRPHIWRVTPEIWWEFSQIRVVNNIRNPKDVENSGFFSRLLAVGKIILQNEEFIWRSGLIVESFHWWPGSILDEMMTGFIHGFSSFIGAGWQEMVVL